MQPICGGVIYPVNFLWESEVEILGLVIYLDWKLQLNRCEWIFMGSIPVISLETLMSSDFIAV